MSKVALVLSGGGAKGAFQFAAEKYAREAKGYTWDIIAGVSVGALNGVMLAMEKYQELESIWNTISNDQVYTGGPSFWSFVKLAFGANSLYGNKPIQKTIERVVEPNKVKHDLRIGTVSLLTGEYKVFKVGDVDAASFKKLVLASTVMPIIWSPIDVSPTLTSMVDGGLRNTSPLGDVLDTDPDEVVVINCSPDDPAQLAKPPEDILEIGKASLEILLNEILVEDVREFKTINSLVQQAEAKGFKLLKKDGVTPFKHYKLTVIAPDAPLGDTLDFSQAAIQKSIRAGSEKASQVLG